MTLNEFKRKYEKLSFEEFSAVCERILHATPPDPYNYEDLNKYMEKEREFEEIAYTRLEDGGL